MKNIRNFCIIAHIDHGKSTLADRLLERTNTIAAKDMEAQVLDDMELERERGITIKSHAIQMNYELNGEKYVLNLIDTPGHVDFSYEVSRSIAACEGALLIVDGSQGIQAQTISNLYMAIDNNLEIIPVINKCDLESANPDEVEDQIVDLLGCDRSEIIRASGKTGMGVDDILQAIVERVPAPKGDPSAPLQALIFDSVFNPFRGIIAYFKIVNGSIRTDDFVKFVSTGKEYHADEIGVLKLDLSPRKELSAGNVGYIISGIKTSREVRVGDTITHVERPCDKAIAGFEEVKPMVFAGVYPSIRKTSKTFARRSKSFSSTMRHSHFSRNHRQRSDSVSAADFSDFCTWRLSRNGSEESSTWMSSPLCQTFHILYTTRKETKQRFTILPDSPIRHSSTTLRSRTSGQQ